MTHPVLASSLPAPFNIGLRAHPSHPTILLVEGNPWVVPRGARALFTFQTQWRTAPLEAPPGWPFDLEWMQVASAGVDTLPGWAYRVPLVTRAAGAHALAIAEYAIGAVFAHEKRIFPGAVHSPETWRQDKRGAIAGKAFGIAGLGEIGREAARLALALGMRVAAISRTDGGMAGVEPMDNFEALLEWSDHLLLALPLTPATRGIVNAKTLTRAKTGLHLINIARGGLVDDAALIAALDSGLLSGATLDVTAPEPPPAGHPFYVHPAIRLTPHISGAVENSDERMIATLTENLTSWLAGHTPRGFVRRDVGY